MKLQVMSLCIASVLVTNALHASSSPVRLVAEVPEEAFVLTPIPIQLAVVNATQEELLLQYLTQPQHVTVVVRDESRGVVYEGPIGISRFAKEGLLKPLPPLMPGGKQSITYVLACRWGEGRLIGPLFEKPGVYSVQFQYSVQIRTKGQDEYPKLQTDEYRIRITDGDAKQAAALAVVRGLPMVAALLEPEELYTRASAEQKQVWEQAMLLLTANHPESPWTPYVQATTVWFKATQKRGDQSSPESLRKGIELADMLVKRKDFAYRDQMRPLAAWLQQQLSAGTSSVDKPVKTANDQQLVNDASVRSDVEKTVRRFMAAHREGRIEECAGMMTEDFVRGRMDRTKSLAKMQKEFDKLKGKKLDAEPTFDSVTTDGTNVAVAISVVYRLAGEQRSQKESYTLRQEQGQWKVSRQEVTYKEPPPGFPPQPPAPKQ